MDRHSCQPAKYTRQVMTSTDERLVHHYRWEFLRRNPEFRAELDDFVYKFSAWFEEHGWWYDPEARAKYTKGEIDYFRKTIQLRKSELMSKWDIAELVPHHWSFDKSGRYELRSGIFVNLPGPVWKERLGDIFVMDEERMGFEANRRISEYYVDEGISGADMPGSFWDRYLYLAVNISFPVKSTVAKIEAEILKARQEYKKKHGSLPRKETRRRRRFDQFEDYLKVWDLKVQRFTLAEISGRLYPGESAVDRVRDQARRAKQLVLGGYREIE